MMSTAERHQQIIHIFHAKSIKDIKQLHYTTDVRCGYSVLVMRRVCVSLARTLPLTFSYTCIGAWQALDDMRLLRATPGGTPPPRQHYHLS